MLTLAAGYLFGPISGTAIVSVAATLGATLAFFVSRYVARPLVLDRLGSNPRFQQISANVDRKGMLESSCPSRSGHCTSGSPRDCAIAQFSTARGDADRSWVPNALNCAAAQMVLLLRLSPLVPFGLLNYMLGLTGISALSFILCSWLGMLPGVTLSAVRYVPTPRWPGLRTADRCSLGACRHNSIRVSWIHRASSTERPQPYQAGTVYHWRHRHSWRVESHCRHRGAAAAR